MTEGTTRGALRNFAKFTGKHLCEGLIFCVSGPEACNFTKKEALAQVIFCEFCEISKNTFFAEHLRTSASEAEKNEVFTNINRIFVFLWYQYDIRNWYHYNMKFYIALRYRYNIIMMLEKDII